MKVLMADYDSMTSDVLKKQVRYNHFYLVDKTEQVKQKIQTTQPDVVILEERLFAYVKEGELVMDHRKIKDVVQSYNPKITWIYHGNNFESLDNDMDKLEFCESIGIQHVFLRPFYVSEIADFINSLS